MNFSEKYNGYLRGFEERLAAFCGDMSFSPELLTDSMRYSLLSGGKRVRPVLFYAALEALGGDWRAETEFALAIECIHTYSLIHDDLPAMDNDDFRRGRPSNHKVFGEGHAVLAGDGLLSLAFSLLLKTATDARRSAAAVLLSDAAGPGGMIAGQSADLLFEGRGAGEEELLFIYRNKTAKLIAAPLEMAAVLTEKSREAMRSFGENLGILFQIRDDLLDVQGEREKVGKTLGKDETEKKLTCVRVFGAEGAEREADRYERACLSALDEAEGDVSFLREMVSYVRRRDC